MVTLETLAETALRRDGLQLRSVAQDFVREHPHLSEIARPPLANQQLLSTAAALLELLAQRTGQVAPLWTREIGAMPEPFFLVEAASHMKRLRALCEREAPEPLRKRGLYAPPDFLSFACGVGHNRIARRSTESDDGAAEHGIAVDRFAREIVAFLKTSLGALAATECQPVIRPVNGAMPRVSNQMWEEET